MLNRYLLGVLFGMCCVFWWHIVDYAIERGTWQNYALSCIVGGLILFVGLLLSERLRK